ncbi:hypothetical protein SARC_11929 [Sphaeroforma arctica JP610]|uniref:Uncharacterized protein n=1 Tax=Sphaeroforma arctica JP610 TaxID=667725 RepID=A0A0L0FFJ6_9EUKA|nr:hypothetical protein SARC_11929 [Sphaeroforma arctica JP610]KNC75552.1 hypothetical protein SARC_11929 [Sphaeroforma arctica JP610]|eukprot:XP_014149454.1 hypothetical protein SARC_11929 [Sphaeroforma arctica JP610]
MPQHWSEDVIPGFDVWAMYFGAGMLAFNFVLIMAVLYSTSGDSSEPAVIMIPTPNKEPLGEDESKIRSHTYQNVTQRLGKGSEQEKQAQTKEQ